MSNNKQSFDPAAWDEFCDTLKATGQQILANTPDDGLDQTEGYRYLARLTHSALGRFVDKPQALRPKVTYNSPRIGGDNPDFVYGSCSITGSQAYRIFGNRKDAYNIGIGSYYGGLGSGKGLQCSGYLLLNDLEVDDQGNFEIIVSVQEQAGTWLPMVAETNSLLFRQTVLDRLNDTPADIQVELVDKSVAPEPVPALEAEAFTQSLKLAGFFVGGVVGQFINWTNTFKKAPNEIHPIDPELLAFAQGDPNTLYHNGYYDLAEDEGLLVELEPPQCEYWNLQVTNYWLESLDYLDYQTHINIANAKTDKDGKVRAVISKTDPGVENWINTAGHDRGCISMRWIKAEHDVKAQCRVVKLTEL